MSGENQSSLHHRIHRKKHLINSFKERANANRKLSEQIADMMTARFGSMIFLGINILFFALWLIINSGLVPGVPVFDPYPFGFLTVIVSLEAIFLAITVLISQNRAARIDDFREEVALRIDTVAEEEISKMIELQLMILKKHGIDISNDPTLQEMLKTDDAEKIEKALEKQLL